MKRLPNTESAVPLSDETAIRIWEEIAYAMDHYTDDSTVASFFQPEHLVAECRLMAASFAMLHYSPFPDMKKIHKSRLYGLFFLSLCCGMQIFLKERAILSQFKPYRTDSSPEAVRIAKNTVMNNLVLGVKMSASVSEVMELFLMQFLPLKERIKRNMKGQVAFHEDMFDKFLPVTIVWGYLFAKELTFDNS